ncbi:hypothetical protein BHE74_00032155 [Ensete ventricosum]|nr:hypothetical protein BHE74_00032155 [Ensete ventricosum]
MFNLRKMKSRGGAGNEYMPSAASVPVVVDVGASTVEKHPSTGEGAGLKKRLRKAAPKQPADASRSTTWAPVEKGKGVVELEEVPKREYTLQELYEVEDRAGADRYFVSIMTQLKLVDSEDPLVPRWSAISGSSLVWTEGLLAREYLQGALHPTLAKQVYEYSEELMNRAGKSVVWSWNRRWEFLHSNLDGARNDRAHLEGDVLLLTEATTFLEAELKAKGPKVVIAYKAS